MSARTERFDGEIAGLHNDLHGHSTVVGSDGVTQIDVVFVHGQMAMVPWFNVWKGDQIHETVNAAHVSRVTYASHEDDR